MNYPNIIFTSMETYIIQTCHLPNLSTLIATLTSMLLWLIVNTLVDRECIVPIFVSCDIEILMINIRLW